MVSQLTITKSHGTGSTLTIRLWMFLAVMLVVTCQWMGLRTTIVLYEDDDYPVESSQNKRVYTPSLHVHNWARDHTSLWTTQGGNTTRRPLASLMVSMANNNGPVSNNITAQPTDEGARDLLDFAIIGHGKCGSTTLLDWLDKHPDCAAFKHENAKMFRGNAQGMIKQLYTDLPDGPHIHRGYKFPQDIRNPQKALATLAHHFPETVLVVGIRHPITWFQSFYNFKVQNLPLKAKGRARQILGNPNGLIDKCDGTDPLSVGKELGCLGTGKGRFHLHLSYLQKHNSTNLVAQALIQDYMSPMEWNQLVPIPNPIFLVDAALLSSNSESPLNDTDDGPERRRLWQLQRDLQAALGLPTEFTQPPGKVSPGKNWNDTIAQQAKNDEKIDICDDEYIRLRKHLLEMSQNISTWIRSSGFLDHPTVMVSSRDHFEEHLRTTWMVDPCDKNDGGDENPKKR